MGKETVLINVDMIGHVGYNKSTTAQTNDIREVLELQKQLAWQQSQFDLLENQVSAMMQGRRCMIVASQSDLYFCRDEWKFYGYPLVLVHEIVGFVTKIGNGIPKFKVGDNVEVGCLERGCDTCEQCTNDSENYCDQAILIYNYIHHDGTRKQVVGNCTGGIKEAQEMLDPTADYSINLDIEVISMSFVNTAMERLLQYRFVIDFSKPFQKWPLHLVEIQIVKELELVLKKQLIISIAFMAIAIAIVSWIALPSKFTIYNFGALVFVVHIASNTGCARDNANKYIAASVSMLASNQGPKGFVHMRLQYASVGNFSARLSSIHGMLLKDSFVGSTLIDMSAKCGNVDAVWLSFDSMPVKSVVSWNEMIQGYEQNGLDENDRSPEMPKLLTPNNNRSVEVDSAEDCQLLSLQDYSCVVYLYSSWCLIWFEDMMNVKELTHVGGSQEPSRVLYLRLATYELPTFRRTKIIVLLVFVTALVSTRISSVALVLITRRQKMDIVRKSYAIQYRKEVYIDVIAPRSSCTSWNARWNSLKAELAFQIKRFIEQPAGFAEVFLENFDIEDKVKLDGWGNVMAHWDMDSKVKLIPRQDKGQRLQKGRTGAR